MNDAKVYDELLARLHTRRGIGRKKYAATITDAVGTDSLVHWLEEALDECLDAAIYLQACIQRILEDTDESDA